MADVTSAVRVVHSASQERYEAFLPTDAEGFDSQLLVGYLDYVSEPDSVVLTHTVVLEEFAHAGAGAALVQSALDDVARSGRRIVPVCSFVQNFIDEHPYYAAMIAK